MKNHKSGKYLPFPPINFPNRQWPSRVITHAPIWASVDLRDGNQSIPTPMNIGQKLELFTAIVKCGFKQIEVGFPAASPTEFAFVRKLIEDNRIPDDVTIQVLTQARRDLILRTVESLWGVKKAIVHLYNSTSPAQRRIVFKMGKSEIIGLALSGVDYIKEAITKIGFDPGKIMLEYSPESFSATEVEFSHAICMAVLSEWGASPSRKVILNLPETVQVAGPNVYADQIEWICNQLNHSRNEVIISVHTHNDRGMGLASSELALLAGADRVEGTLFGNGERTGNLDIVTLALNLESHGIDSGLDFSDINALREVYERTTGMTVHERHPYAGELVFTAFSGSHQDAIKKGLADWREQGGKTQWEVPYLAIDPEDIGREYHEVIRVNSQSGKSGISHLLETKFGILLPKGLAIDFSAIANVIIDELGREVGADELRDMFLNEYVRRDQPWKLSEFSSQPKVKDTECHVRLLCQGCPDSSQPVEFTGVGNGPLAALVHGLNSLTSRPHFEITEYSEHVYGIGGQESAAIAYIEIKMLDGKRWWGSGMDTNMELASVKAVLSALNRVS